MHIMTTKGGHIWDTDPTHKAYAWIAKTIHTCTFIWHNVQDEDRVRCSEKEKDLQARIEKLQADLFEARSELERLKWEQTQGVCFTNNFMHIIVFTYNVSDRQVQSLKKATACACLERVDSGNSSCTV